MATMACPDRPARAVARAPDWAVAGAPVGYPEALAAMEARVAAIRAGRAAELVWLLEHPALYTAGTSARAGDLLEPGRFPVFRAGRGGEFTWHGPGQRVAYLMLDLAARRRDLRCFVRDVEDWVILALAALGVRGERRAGRVGIWVVRADRPAGPDGRPAEDKVAAIGLRLRRWVSFHGVAINVDPDLDAFGGIVPCGIRDHGVTSLRALGATATMADLDRALRASFSQVFG